MEILKKLRMQKGISQKELAKQIGIEYQNYNKYELGKNEPNLTTIKKLADFFDVSLDFLLQRPHPHDLPIATTEEQKSVIATILKLNKANTIKAHSYCLGLLAGQE